MKKVIYKLDGDKLSTIYGIGSTDEEALKDAIANGLDVEDVEAGDYFTLDATDEAYESLAEDGGDDIFDDRFVVIYNERGNITGLKMRSSLTKERIEEIADEVEYTIRNEEAWMDYCDSVMSDESVTEAQVREELSKFKKIEEEV